jgi:curli production assembly/transport component CsgG
VLDFQISGKEFEHKGSEAAILLNAKLSAAPNLILVERQELEKILSEHEIGLSGTVSQDTAAKVGNLTGAKVLVTGRIFGAGDKYYVVAKIISTETSRVFGEMATFSDAGAFEKAIDELAPKISAVIDKRAGALVAKVEEPAARIERLKKIVAGKKLLSVSVKIDEQHLHRPTIDPAAQTEMKLVLQQVGFDVIDTKESNKEPDVTISGEAFSELATRRGSLIACRGRVEIKVVRAGGGRLLLADRRPTAASISPKMSPGKTRCKTPR